MGTWSSPTVTTSTTTDYTIGWQDYTGPNYLPSFGFDSLNPIDDSGAESLTDGMALSESVTFLTGAHATATKTVAVTTYTVTTYTP